MNNFFWILILILIVFFVSNNNILENYQDNIHNNTFWNYWNTPNYLREKKFPLWGNIYWGPSYWPGGYNIKV